MSDVTDPDVSLADLVEPLRATAWACRAEEMPRGSALDLISDKPNRWNAEGEPTIYVCSDAALALVEMGRHPEDLKERSHLLRLDVRLDRVIDLRRPAVRATLGVPAGEAWVLDHGRTRELAVRVRGTGACDGLIVPSAGALDQDDRWNAVIFANDGQVVPGRVGDPRHAGTLLLDTEGGLGGQRRH